MSEEYNFGYEEGYKAGFDKGWADCEFQQKGAVKAMARQVEELNKSTGFAELQNKVAGLQLELDATKRLQKDHTPCHCELCKISWWE